MANALLGALVATKYMSVVDAEKIAEFVNHVETLELDVPDLYAGIDLALGYFNDAPDAEAQKTAQAIQETNESSACPDCGGEMMDEVDMEQAIDRWVAVRMVADKYTFDREYDGGREEC